MIFTDSETIEVIKQNNRHFRAFVHFSFLSVRSPEAIKIHAPNAVHGCIVDDIVYPYRTHIKNRVFMNMSLKPNAKTLAPMLDSYNRVFPSIHNRYTNNATYTNARREPTTHIGYIGSKADGNGNVNDTITQIIPMCDIERITIRSNPDRIIKNASLKIFRNYLQEPEHIIEIKNNNKAFLEIDIEVTNTTQLQLHITKATPNKRVWLVSFYAGFEYQLDERDIVKIKHQQKKTENKEGSIGRLYLNTIELKLSNIERIFDKENPASKIAKHLTGSATFTVTLSLLQGKMQQPLIIDLGLFAVTDFSNNLADADITLKGADFIGREKDSTLNLGIKENVTAYDLFREIALKLNLEPTGIDNALKNVHFSLMPLNGPVTKILNQLCSTSNAFCTTRGNVLVATLLKSRRATIRYPQRYFQLNEYKQKTSGKTKEVLPNVVNLTYSDYEYEDDIFVKDKKVLMYSSQIPKKTLEQNYQDMSLVDYINKNFLPKCKGKTTPESFKPSFEATYTVPANFHHAEISDEFIYRNFEYKIDNIRNASTGKIESVRVRMWRYAERDSEDQCTILLCVKEKPTDSIISTQDFRVESKAEVYKPNTNTSPPADYNSPAEIEVRNEPNAPEVFTMEVDGNVDIGRVEVANYFLPSQFEFYYTPTQKGIEVRAWNYLETPQTLTVNIYGTRLKKSENKTTLQARNEDSIRLNGEIIKNITVEGVSSKESAHEILKNAIKYYKEFSGELQAQTWADPRIQLYDYLAFRKLRYNEYQQGIVEEITSEYAGYLTQTLKLKETVKHNRDCRVCGSYILKDRPVQKGDLSTIV